MIEKYEKLKEGICYVGKGKGKKGEIKCQYKRENQSGKKYKEECDLLKLDKGKTIYERQR